MRLWVVKVIGERKPKPKRAWWRILVEAETDDEAMRIAVAYAEGIADSESLWAGFYAAEAATTMLPLRLGEQRLNVDEGRTT